MESIRKISSSSLYADNYLISQDSIISSLNRFLQSVENMNEVVMVPSKLHDLKADLKVNGSVDISDLYENYKMLVNFKNNILWGTGQSSENANPQFKHHLQRLHQLLNQYSDIANHLVNKYQSETGSHQI